MNILIYIPTGLNSPELEILIAKAQKEINKKNNVTILTCKGGKGYYCAKNLLSQRSICYVCKSNRKRGIEMLKGKFNLIETPYLEKKNFYSSKKKFQNLLNYKFNKCDNGISAYSSYLVLSRDRDLNGFLASNIIKNLVSTSNNLTIFFNKFIKKKKFDEIYLFNGRMNIYRPLLRIASLKKINVNNLEFNGNRNQIFNFKDKLPMEHKILKTLMESNWKKNKHKVNLVDKFVKKWIKQQRQVHKSKFDVVQTQNLLPENWDVSKRNIIYFVSSDDEQLTGGPEYFYKIFKNQLQSILEIYKMIKKEDNFKTINFWVRMHPRLTGLNWPYLKSIMSLKKKLKKINVILPKSEISSYAMLKNSSLVITPVSSLSMDAVYFKKPVINFINNPFALMKGSYIPSSKKIMRKLLFNEKLKPRSLISAKMHHLFYLTGGEQYNEVQGNCYGNFKH